MIVYTEKGFGLHEAITAAGHYLQQTDDGWISSDDVVVQAIIDAYDPLEPNEAAKLAARAAASAVSVVEKQTAHLDLQIQVAQLQAVINGSAKALADMDVIIAGVDASTNAQLRVMVKDMARAMKAQIRDIKDLARASKRIIRVVT